MDKYPEDKLAPETYFSSEQELRLYTNYFYKLMPTGTEMYEEEGDHFVAPVPSRDVQGTRLIPETDSKWNWEVLRKINFYLSYSSNCDDEDARAHYDGVARFFRAYFYFLKVRNYGDVPWYSQVVNSDDKELLAKPRDSRQLVVDSIIADLDFAIENLPETHTPYEVNKWTALALKSRVCLFEGTFRKYHAGKTFNPNNLPWEDLLATSAEAAEILMNESGYTIYSDGEQPYRDLFASLNANPKEFIWARCYSADLNIKNNANAWSVARTTGFTKRHVNMYLNVDGTRFTDIQGYDTLGYVEECKNRDPRMAQTIHTPGYIQYGETKTYPVDLKQSSTGYKYIKYVMEKKYNTWDASLVCLPIFRMGEVLLNFAEAKAELGTLTQADLDKSINVLRDRVGMPHLDMATANANPCAYMEKCYPNVSQSANKGVIMEIRRERLIETPLEGLHYWDIMRWREGKAFTQPYLGIYFPGPGKYDMTGSGKASINLMEEGQTGGGGIGVTKLYLGSDVILTNGTLGNMWAFSTLNFQFDENKDYLYPIPTNERVLTNGALTQNPGWNDGLSF
ncbi:MAG: RagB/SusD family nutrient uptake outer membrane protein [Bacteroidaceae bacterium]|nr:RagB/SusD family nutrient uptake outer membrane protein [Bacteroidaceae bacterium]